MTAAMTIDPKTQKLVPVTEVVLKGAAIATIDMKDGTMKVVIFRPTKETHKLVTKYVGKDIDVAVEDANGKFTPQRPQFISDWVYEPNIDTMIVDTADADLDS